VISPSMVLSSVGPSPQTTPRVLSTRELLLAVISLELCSGLALDLGDADEETANPFNTFSPVATSTSFANYFPTDDTLPGADESHPADEDIYDGVRELREHQREDLCEPTDVVKEL